MRATIIEISQKTFLIASFCREFFTEFFKKFPLGNAHSYLEVELQITRKSDEE
jgi:hypothetical protein